ncbi:unnamed protein product [Nesidiocoris tenuis]|uniref:Uncharacterized protein n=1 Tax=Nesidiocoris tenuis TaxID=355587 RepID=A0A6H5FZ19_9HEMI|nr:unnamed protein product [Nesidiocoris tenuis]
MQQQESSGYSRSGLPRTILDWLLTTPSKFTHSNSLNLFGVSSCWTRTSRADPKIMDSTQRSKEGGPNWLELVEERKCCCRASCVRLAVAGRRAIRRAASHFPIVPRTVLTVPLCTSLLPSPSLSGAAL